MVDPNQYHIAAVSDLNGYIFSSQTADCHVSAAGQDRKYAIILLFHPHSSTQTDVAAAEGSFEFHSTLMRKFQCFFSFFQFILRNARRVLRIPPRDLCTFFVILSVQLNSFFFFLERSLKLVHG